MGKGGKIAIIVGVVILFLVLIYFLGRKKVEPETVVDKWIETYDPSDKGPYGTYILKELLDTTGLFGNFLQINKKIEEQLEDNEAVNDIYFFVGKQNYMTEESGEFLLDFVESGNTVFMVCEYFPYNFTYLFTDEDVDFMLKSETYDSMQTFSFTNSQLKNDSFKSKFIFNNLGKSRSWQYIDTSHIFIYHDDEDTLIVCGTNEDDNVNFIKIRYGNGYIFFHSTPYLFTNISMMKTDGFKYVENVLRHIPPGRIQWDKYNLETHYEYDFSGSGGGEKRESILQFLLANPPLAWATILLLVGALLYAVFKGKRMQKIIPGRESKENTSLEYINTLSTLYLRQNKHSKLIKLKERTFLSFIADHYYILGKPTDKNFIQRISLKSQIPEDKITDIFHDFVMLEGKSDVSDDDLISLHQKIEYFYKKCR